MARHEKPDEYERPLCTYVCNCSHFPKAIEASKFLSQFNCLKVWETQYQKTRDHTTWYVGFAHRVDDPEPFLLNINIYSDRFDLEFRHQKCLPNDFAKLRLSPTKNWQIAKSNENSRAEIQKLLKGYIENIRKDYDDKNIKYYKMHTRKTDTERKPVDFKCPF
jgi:hypothetical protein